MGRKILIIGREGDFYNYLQQQLISLNFAETAIILLGSVPDALKVPQEDIFIIFFGCSKAATDIQDINRLSQHFFKIPVISIVDNKAGMPELNNISCCLSKDELLPAVLDKVIHYEVERKSLKGKLDSIRFECNAFFADNPYPMWLFDMATLQFLAVNKAAINEYGYSKDEFLSMSVSDMWPAEDVDRMKIKINYSTHKSGFYNSKNIRHVKKDRQIANVSVNSYATHFNGIKAKVAMIINIDNEIQYKQALEQKVSEVENILESIDYSFFAVDKNWNFTYINKKCEALYNISKEKLLHTRIWDTFKEAVGLKYFSELHRAVQEHVSVHFEEFSPSINKWVFFNAYPTNNGLSVYITDITEQKQHLNKIRSQNEKLKEIARIQSHEIRGPVATILGLANLFNYGNPQDEINTEVLTRLREATGNLDKAIHDIVGKTEL